MNQNLKDIVTFIIQFGAVLLILAMVLGYICHVWQTSWIRYFTSFILAYGATIELFAIINCKKIANLESQAHDDEQ